MKTIYPTSTTNTDTETGIHYGVISANSLCPDIVEQLLWGSQTTNFTLEEIEIEELGDYDFNVEEPDISGTYEDVFYSTLWLGGGLNFFIFRSEHVVKTNLCSPCVPNAGNLDDKVNGEFETYDVPSDWRINTQDEN